MTTAVATRPRDSGLEAHLRDIAVHASGLPNDGGLAAFADMRAHPGGVRAHMDPDRECAEELADAWNYLRWGIEQVWDAYLLGDPDAARTYERRMRAMVALLAAWYALHSR